MPAEKNECVILSIAPYRETSCLLRLFTRTHGLIHGIAKGVRKGGKSSTPLDRGFLIEALVYCKPNRELHTLGSPHVTNFFGGIRSNLIKSAIRDIALELYLKTITQSEPHPELFDLIVDFLGDMDKSVNPHHLFPMLWNFISRYCMMTGFGIDTENSRASGLDDAVIKIINEAEIRTDTITNNTAPRRCQKDDCLYVTEQLLSYCRRHFDIRHPFNSLEFLRSMR